MTITQGTKITDGTTQFIVNDITDGIPVGDVVFRPYLKDGYLSCNGQGNGSTTMTIPNYQDRVCL